MNKVYRKLAFINIRNNSQFYLPYILMGILSVMMFYSLVAMGENESLVNVRGSGSLRMILGMGSFVIGIFVCILLFYANSFIMKRRKKELGVYNILGMEKRHIAKILFWENFSACFAAVAGGLIFGIVFNKLLMMFLYRITGLSESISFYVSKKGCMQTVILFSVIYLLALCYNFMQIKLANPIELLHGGNAGEREPKTKLFLALFGGACLAAAYYIAFTTENIMQVLTLFLLAVLLVIFGTYALFTAGSIVLLKSLRKNKKYYYKTKHFTAVSGLLYRMKQNAAGLASICILSTMVLVMISTTISLYMGVGDEVENQYSGDVEITLYFNYVPDKDYRDTVLSEIKNSIKDSGRCIESCEETVSLEEIFIRKGNVIETVGMFGRNMAMEEIGILSVLTKDDYEKRKNTTLSDIKKGQAAIIAAPEFTEDTVSVLGMEFKVVESRRISYEDDMLSRISQGGEMCLVVSDNQTLEDIFSERKALAGKQKDAREPQIEYNIAINFDGTKEEKIACTNGIRERVMALVEQGERTQKNVEAYSVESKQEGYDDYMSLNGGLLFLGLFLGLMFSMVTVLIIYYKQISEGYEDKERFAIMEKVGMSSREVKDAIKSQVRIVFFLPLATAGIHLAAAFPMLQRLLAMLNLYNSRLFAICLLVTLLVFGVIYFAVFKVTSKTYYKIVGEQF